VFGGNGNNVALSSTKASTGHLLGAAGAIEAIYSIMALRKGVLPASINLDDPMEGTEVFSMVANKAVERQVDYVLSNSFGFGGTNACLVLQRFDG
jgi:3-oxoacyl-[acyl-carrier-protein] synthase II